MAAAAEQYTEEIYDALRYWATWLPATSLSLGACGPIRGRVFTPEAALADFGIGCDDVGDGAHAELQYVSRDAVSYDVQLSGGSQVIPNIPQGTAGIRLAFGREHAVVLVLKAVRERRVANMPAVKDQLTEQAEAGTFPREYAVLTHLVTAGSAAVLVSSGRSGSAVFSAQADLQAGLVDLANANLGLKLVAEQGMETHFVARSQLTPLFRLSGFKKRAVWLGRRRLGGLQFDDDGDPGTLSELTPADADQDA